MSKVNPNNGNESKLDIFPYDISDITFYCLQNTKLFRWLL